MAGHFYPPPPPFIGGRQPLAPKDALPQSGPTPDPPPKRSYAQQAGIRLAWEPGPPVFIGGQQSYAPRLGMPQSGAAPAAPVLEPYAALESIAAWAPRVTGFIGGQQEYAPRLGQPQSGPTPSQPPIRPNRSAEIISGWWAESSVTTIWLASVAPFVAVDVPPTKPRDVPIWAPPDPTFIGGRQAFAPRLGIPQSGPTPSQPPAKTNVFFTIRDAWNPAAYALPQAGEIAGVLATAEVASQPPPLNLGAYYEIRRLWDQQPYALPEGASFAPLAPAPITADAPPVQSLAAFYAIRQLWEPQPYALPQAADFAPLVPEVLDAPPPSTWARVFAVREQWNPAHYRLPSAGKFAPILPAVTPDQPPPRAHTQALLNVLDSWDTAAWPTQRRAVLTESGPTVYTPQLADVGRLFRTKGPNRTLQVAAKNRTHKA